MVHDAIEMYVHYLCSFDKNTLSVIMQELGDRVNQMVHECFSTTIQTIFLIVVFAFMTILQIIGIVLAIQTRKIKIKLLNDSKYIAAVIYICSVSLAFIAVVTLVPGIYINIIEGVFSGSVVTANTFFLALIFIPKVQYFSLLHSKNCDAGVCEAPKTLD